METKENIPQQPRRKSTRRRSSIRKKSNAQKKPQFSSADKLSRLEMYEQEDQNNPLNQQLRPYEKFAGPKKDRTITDTLCIPIFIILVIVLFAHGIIIITFGDSNRLSNHMDFRAEICGVDGLVHLPYLYYGSPSQDIKVSWCVQECPQSTGTKICMYDIDHFTVTPFCYVQMKSDQIGRFCMPNEPVNRVSVESHVTSTQYQVKRFASDIWLSKDLILISIILLLIMAFSLTMLLGIDNIVKYQIWLAVWGSIICFSLLCWLFYREYERVIQTRCLFDIDKHNCGGQRAILFRMLSYIIAFAGLFYFIYVLTLFNKINLGIGLIKAASQVVQVLSQIRFFSIIVVVVGMFFSIFIFYIVIYGLTIGSISVEEAKDIDGKQAKLYTSNSIAQITLAYPGFMLIFLLMFLLLVNEMFISYSLSVWFFTKKKETVQIPLIVIYKEVIFHHLGTCIYLTFMQILFFIPKLIMQQIHYSLRSLPQQNIVVRYTLKHIKLYFNRFLEGCCFCCLASYQHCLRFISKHSMVQVAIWSENYSLSSQKAYFLLSRNRSKIRDLDTLVEFILFQLKICNSLFCAMPIYVILTFAPETLVGVQVSDIESPLVPTMFVFFFGFFLNSIFQGTYDLAAKSIIQLYLVDREMFYGEQRFTEKFIQEFLDFYGEQEQEKIKMKSNKQQKYTAKVVPADETPLNQDDDDDDEDEEEDDEEDDDDYDDEDEDGSEEQEYDVGSEQSGEPQMNMNVKPSQGKLIDSDPFALGEDAKSQDSDEIGSQSQFKSQSQFNTKNGKKNGKDENEK